MIPFKSHCHHRIELFLAINSRYMSKRGLRLPPIMLLCLDSKPWCSSCRESCSAKSHAGQCPMEASGRCSVDGSKVCFSAINFYFSDLGQHMLQGMWNISVDYCTVWCVQSSSMISQPQAYSEKYQHWQILNAGICPALCPLTDIWKGASLSKSWSLGFWNC